MNGRVPPQDIELEEAVLGAIMLEKDAILRLPNAFKPNVLYKEAHQLILMAAMALFNESNPIDMFTLTTQLRKTNELERIGGAYTLAQITHRVSSTASLEYNCYILIQLYELRCQISLAQQILKQAYEPGAKAEEINTMLGNFNPIEHTSTKTFKDQLKSNLDRLNAAAKQVGPIGVESSLSCINRVTNGWQKTDLVILAARPGMGKSALALQEIKHAAKLGYSVAMFSLEMGDYQLINRALADEANMNLYLLNNPKEINEVEWQNLNTAISKMYDLKFLLDDTPAIDITYMRRALIKHKRKHGLDLVVVDYLQLMRGSGKAGNREQEISEISRGLKSIAKELNVPVIALSQLSRNCELRADKRPLLSDLRESGAIEQDADMVIFEYRDEYYNVTEDSEGNSTIGIAEIIFAKHRNGGTGNEKCRFISGKTKFADLETFNNFDV